MTKADKASKAPKKGTKHPVIPNKEETADNSLAFYTVRTVCYVSLYQLPLQLTANIAVVKTITCVNIIYVIEMSLRITLFV